MDDEDTGSRGLREWKKIVRGEMGTIEGIMGGDLDLHGDMNTLLMNQKVATTFFNT